MKREELLSRYEKLGNKLNATGTLSAADEKEMDLLVQESIVLRTGDRPANVVPFVAKERQMPKLPNVPVSARPVQRQREPVPSDLHQTIADLRNEVRALRSQPARPAEQPRPVEASKAQPAPKPRYSLVVHRSGDDLIRSISIEPVE